MTSTGLVQQPRPTILWQAVLSAPVLGMALALALSWSQLPATVATHFGAGGRADGFASRGVGLAIGFLAVPAVLVAVCWLTARKVPPTAPGLRAVVAFLIGMNWLTTSLLAGSLIAQRNLADAHDAVLAPSSTLLAMLIGLTGGGLAYRLTPQTSRLPARAASGHDSTDADPSDPDGSSPGPGAAGVNRAPIWAGVARPSAAAILPLGLLALLGVVVATKADSVSTAFGMVALTVVLPALVVFGVSSFRITLSEQAVIARARLGWPRLSLPTESITAADTTTLKPMEWGGWGLRYNSQGTGVITRRGEALRLRRTDDSVVVITVDDAAGAAAAVNELIAGREQHEQSGAVDADPA